VPNQSIEIKDDGYSGATLERPGLERVRDLAAEGQIQVVLAYAPDRLSRKYAYQILLIEELARNGVETLFIKAPQGSSAEDQLLVPWTIRMFFLTPDTQYAAATDRPHLRRLAPFLDPTDRGDGGNVGIIRSPLRATVLPD
jgi:hypothetical protein